MGSLLTFVNRVASEFPDKIISTLAYQYTRKPPRTIRPADNVHIMLCNIECNRSRPIAVDPDSTPFREDLLAWAAVSENLFIWDYVVQFAHLVSPFPNFRVLGPNIKLFAENNVRGIFSQGNREVGGEFSELRAYILAKLSWDINYDVERGIQEFLDLYYGPAAEPIGRYMKRIHNTLDQSHSQLRIFEGPQEAATTYLREQLIGEYIGLFDDAEAAVGDDGELLLRVRTARLPLQYAILRLSYGTEALRRRELDSFAEVSALTGLEKVEEWRYTVSAFVNDMRKALQ